MFWACRKAASKITHTIKANVLMIDYDDVFLSSSISMPRSKAGITAVPGDLFNIAVFLIEQHLPANGQYRSHIFARKTVLNLVSSYPVKPHLL